MLLQLWGMVDFFYNAVEGVDYGVAGDGYVFRRHIFFKQVFP